MTDMKLTTRYFIHEIMVLLLYLYSSINISVHMKVCKIFQI